MKSDLRRNPAHDVPAYEALQWPERPDNLDAIAEDLEELAGDSETVVLADDHIRQTIETNAVPETGSADFAEPGEPSVASKHISPLQETLAHDLMRDLAASADVVFVRLVAPQGTPLAIQGSENGDPVLDAMIADAMRVAQRETNAQAFGESHYLSIESDRAALLVAPVWDGVVLAVYVSNPARLGLLRRQIRKPVLGLRALLMDSRVS